MNPQASAGAVASAPASRAWPAAGLGLASGLAQVVLLRELLTLGGGNELTLALGLAAWLGLGGLGSLLAGRLARRRPLASPLPALLLAGLGGLAGLLLARLAPGLLGLAPGQVPGWGQGLACCLLALGPAGLAVGGGFALLLGLDPEAAGEAESPRRLARLYGLEALGAAAAGALFAVVLAPRLSPLGTLLAGALAASLIGGLSARGLARWLGLACGLLLALGLARSTAWDHALRQLAWPSRQVLAQSDEPYAQLLATRQGEQSDFFANGAWLFSSPLGQRQERLALLPLLAQPQARRALFVGGVASGAAAAMAQAAQVQVTAVELDPWLLQFCQPLLPACSPPKGLQVIEGDGRLYLRRTHGHFDLVVVDMPGPGSVQMNRFYSQEGFTSLAHALGPQGVAVVALPGVGEALGRLQARQLGAVMAAAQRSFSQVLPFLGPELLLFCSQKADQVPSDPAAWLTALKERAWPGVTALRPDLLTEALDPMRRALLLAALDQAGPHRPNRDLQPRALLLDPQTWGAQLGQAGGLALALAGLNPWHLAWPLLALAGLLAWAGRRGWGPRAALPALGGCLAVAGATSTALSYLLIMAWQVLFGSVYLGLALLMGAFMLGLGAASLLLAGRTQGIARPAAWLALLGWLLVLACLATLGAVQWLKLVALPGRGYETALLALAVLDGGLTGAYFALAGLLRGQFVHAGLAAWGGALYALDLGGGMLGALLPLALVPSLGFNACLLLLALLNLAGLAAARGLTRQQPAAAS